MLTRICFLSTDSKSTSESDFESEYELSSSIRTPVAGKELDEAIVEAKEGSATTFEHHKHFESHTDVNFVVMQMVVTILKRLNLDPAKLSDEQLTEYIHVVIKAPTKKPLDELQQRSGSVEIQVSLDSNQH